MLFIVDLFVYSIMSMILFSLMIGSKQKWSFFVLYTITCLWAITAVNFFALRHINKYTKLLAVEGIVANESFVKFYIGFLAMMAFCYTMQLVMNSIARG